VPNSLRSLVEAHDTETETGLEGFEHINPPFRGASTVISKLAPPNGFNPALHEGYWATDDPDELRELMDISGYRVWSKGDSNRDRDGKNGSQLGEGSAVRIHGGVMDNGDGHRLIFMYRPKSFRTRQQQVYRKELADTMKQLDPKENGDMQRELDGGRFTGSIDFS